MRIQVRHDTSYDYSEPVGHAVQLMRMTPRSCGCQFVRRWRVEIDADARLSKGEDAYGNITHIVFLEGALEHVRIHIEGEVETSDQNGIVSGTLERLPLSLFLRQTALTAPSPELTDLSRDCKAGEGGDLLATLHRLNELLHRDMHFDTSATTVETTAAEAFKARQGVCQDFAHVFIASARSLNVPARYVSGYYLRTDRTEQEAGHAWAEAFVPGLGWIAFDPTHGSCATDRHIRVAVGADAHEAAPVRGAQVGGSDERLTVSINVQTGRGMIEE